MAEQARHRGADIAYRAFEQMEGRPGDGWDRLSQEEKMRWFWAAGPTERGRRAYEAYMTEGPSWSELEMHTKEGWAKAARDISLQAVLDENHNLEDEPDAVRSQDRLRSTQINAIRREFRRRVKADAYEQQRNKDPVGETEWIRSIDKEIDRERDPFIRRCGARARFDKRWRTVLHHAAWTALMAGCATYGVSVEVNANWGGLAIRGMEEEESRRVLHIGLGIMLGTTGWKAMEALQHGDLEQMWERKSESAATPRTNAWRWIDWGATVGKVGIVGGVIMWGVWQCTRYIVT